MLGIKTIAVVDIKFPVRSDRRIGDLMGLALSLADHVENDRNGRRGSPAIVAVEANDLRMMIPAGKTVGIGGARHE